MKRLPLKTAVIGVGNMGKNHVRVYSEISHLTAVVDANAKAARVIAAEYDVPWYTTPHDLLKNHRPDAVSVVVPTSYHAEIAKIFLREKIPTLVEKPITDTLVSANKLKDLAIETRTFFMVGHVERFNPVVVHIKKLIDQGKFGDIINLLSVRVGVSPPQAKGSDVALDLAIHDIDIFNYLLSATPVNSVLERQKLVSGNTGDAVSIMITYPHTIGLIQANWVTPIKIRKLYITGTQRFAELDYINQQIIMLEKVTPKPVQNYFELVNLSDIPLREVYTSRKEPLKEELKYFLKHCRCRPNAAMITSAVNALKVCL